MLGVVCLLAISGVPSPPTARSAGSAGVPEDLVGPVDTLAKQLEAKPPPRNRNQVQAVEPQFDANAARTVSNDLAAIAKEPIEASKRAPAALILVASQAGDKIGDTTTFADFVAEQQSKVEQEKLLDALYEATRPGSGSQTADSPERGLGAFHVRNSTGRDAVVVLMQGDAQKRAVYVRDGERATIARVAVGAYEIRFATGRWWDGTEFRKDGRYQEFDRAAVFDEKPGEQGTTYSEFEVSLQPVVGGNARTRSITPFKLSGEVVLEKK